MTTTTTDNDEIAADGGVKQEQDNDEVDVHEYDITPTAFEFETKEGRGEIRTHVRNNTHWLMNIKGTDIWVAYTTWQTPASEADGWSIKGIGRLSIDAVELDADNIEENIIDNVEESGIDDLATLREHSAELAERLAHHWQESAEMVVRESVLGDTPPAFTGSKIITTSREALHHETRFAYDEVGIDVSSTGKHNLQSALHGEVQNHADRELQANDQDYIAEVSFDIEAWELRAIELQQNASFPRKTAECVAVNEEESMKRDVAQRLDVSTATVSDHLKRAQKLVDEARWTVRNVDL